MVQSERLHYHPSVVELARRGSLRAISAWLNAPLQPYGMRAYVGSVPRSSMVKVLIELPIALTYGNVPEQWHEYLVRFLCHRLCQLNSALIDGVRIAVRFQGETKPLWQKSVRIVTPASRLRHQRTRQIHSRIRYASRRKSRLQTIRSFLTSGPAIAAFIIGGIIGYARAPVEQTNASASRRVEPPVPTLPQRPDTVRAALETVPVMKFNQVANPKDPEVKLLFAGDVTLSDFFEEVMGKDYQKAFAQLDEYRQADVAMVNLENPLTRATLPLPDKQFNFKAKPESVEVLKSGGVDIVNLANNHAMDFEAAGLTETMSTLDKAGIYHIGAGRDIKEARRPKIIDVKGQRIAYLGYYGELHPAGDNQAGTNPIVEAKIAEDIRAIRDQVDWIIVNYHWGAELADYPADWQVQLAHFTIDQGADLIVGHHPHVLQGAEIYKGRAIAYSLGNFIFGGNSRTDYDTAVLKVSIKDKQLKAEFLPVQVTGYQPKIVADERGAEILGHINTISSSFKQPMKSPTILDAQAPTASSETTPATETGGSTIAPPAVETPGETNSVPTNAPAPQLPDATAPLTDPAPPADTPAPAPTVVPTPTESVAPVSPAQPEDSPTPTPGPAVDGLQSSPLTDPSAPVESVPAAPPANSESSTPSEAPQSADPFTDAPNRTPLHPVTPGSPSPEAPSMDSTMLPPSPQLPPRAMLEAGRAQAMARVTAPLQGSAAPTLQDHWVNRLDRASQTSRQQQGQLSEPDLGQPKAEQQVQIATSNRLDNNKPESTRANPDITVALSRPTGW